MSNQTKNEQEISRQLEEIIRGKLYQFFINLLNGNPSSVQQSPLSSDKIQSFLPDELKQKIVDTLEEKLKGSANREEHQLVKANHQKKRPLRKRKR